MGKRGAMGLLRVPEISGVVDEVGELNGVTE